MIDLAAQWLTEAAHRAAEDEDSWYAARPTWLALDEQMSIIVEGSTPIIGSPVKSSPVPQVANKQHAGEEDTIESEKRWAAKYRGLAKHHTRCDIQKWRDECVRQPAPVFPFFVALTASFGRASECVP